MKYLEFVNNNLYLYLAIIIALSILNVILTIICINQRKRKNIKEEFEEVSAVDEEVKPEVAFELEKILEKMQHDVEMQPEEVVRKFEEEQEQKAIISYQELVDSVNNNKIDVVDDEEGDVDYVAALSLDNTTSNTESIKDEKEENGFEIMDDYANKSHLDVIDEINFEDEPKRFKNSEILSPVFGRIQPDFEYKKVNSFANNKIEVEQVSGNTQDVDIKKNEDFLKALIEFRNNL